MTNPADDEPIDVSLAAYLADDGEVAAVVRGALARSIQAPDDLVRLQIDAALGEFDRLRTASAAADEDQRAAARVRARGRRRSWLLAGFGSIAAAGGLAFFVGTSINSADENSSADASARLDAPAETEAASFDGEAPVGGAEAKAAEADTAPAPAAPAAPAKTDAPTAADLGAGDAIAESGLALPPEFTTIEQLTAYGQTLGPIAESFSVASPAPCPTAPGMFVSPVVWQGVPANAYATDDALIVLDEACAVIAQAPRVTP